MRNLCLTYRLGFLLVFSLFFQILNAQDIHFSQYFANPISFNPAHTGFFDGNVRLGINHKQQWPWAIDGKFLNYNTSSAFIDFSLFNGKLNKTDWMGMGFNFINDQSGDGNLTLNKALLSLAYHKGLDKDHKHFLSIGASFSFVNRRINFGALYFNNQWVDRVGFDLTLPNQEDYATESTNYMDFSMGIQGKNQLSDKLNIQYGYTLLHLNTPTESFYNQQNELGIRHIAFTSLDYQINSVFSLNMGTYYTNQKKASEWMMNGLAGFKLKSNNKKTSQLYAGVLYRFKDALSPIVGYQYHQTRVLLNYDINLSSLSKASKGNGGFELSLVQIIKKQRSKSNMKTFCPKF